MRSSLTAIIDGSRGDDDGNDVDKGDDDDGSGDWRTGSLGPKNTNDIHFHMDG